MFKKVHFFSPPFSSFDVRSICSRAKKRISFIKFNKIQVHCLRWSNRFSCCCFFALLVENERKEISHNSDCELLKSSTSRWKVLERKEDNLSELVKQGWNLRSVYVSRAEDKSGNLIHFWCEQSWKLLSRSLHAHIKNIIRLRNFWLRFFHSLKIKLVSLAFDTIRCRDSTEIKKDDDPS